MQIRYVRTDDLDVLEGTVNLLLAQGWELYTNAFITHTNDYFVTLVNYQRPQRGSARAEDIPVVRGPLYRESARGESIPTAPGRRSPVGGDRHGSPVERITDQEPCPEEPCPESEFVNPGWARTGRGSDASRR